MLGEIQTVLPALLLKKTMQTLWTEAMNSSQRQIELFASGPSNSTPRYTPKRTENIVHTAFLTEFSQQLICSSQPEGVHTS